LAASAAVAAEVSTAPAPAAAPAPAVAAPAVAAPAAVSTGPLTWGVHLTGWAAGSPRARREFIRHMKAAGLNTVVIALKEYDGRMFVKDVPLARTIGAYVNAIPDLPGAVRDFKDQGIYTIGRIVLMKDDILAHKRPDLAVHRPDGALWVNDKGVAWVDPYRREVWEYNLAIASRAAQVFDEIQFDYIRFPSDGPTRLCRYSRQDDSPKTQAKNLADLMAFFRKNLPGTRISVAVFGLTTTDTSGMGIGQHLDQFVKEADFVSPMMYPSHYAKGEYGLKNPNAAPYQTIHRGLRKVAALGQDMSKLRPYFQDFSLGKPRYGAAEVRAQIFAAARMGVRNWLLWNPQNHYTWSAIPKLDELPPPGSPEPEGADRPKRAPAKAPRAAP
jgi:hypothetical protein